MLPAESAGIRDASKAFGATFCSVFQESVSVLKPHGRAGHEHGSARKLCSLGSATVLTVQSKHPFTML
jgi:hypothetical protein